jgi:acyl carrier protein
MSTEMIVRHAIAARLEVPDEQVGLDIDLRSLENFDSIHALQIVLDIEERFGIEVEDHVVFGIQTVREFAAKIDEIVAESADAPAAP